MFPNYNGKLLLIIWMGVGSAILTSIFSAVIIKNVWKLNKRVKQIAN